MHDPSRRRVLRTGGTLFAGGLTVSLGGCLQSDGTGTPTDDGDDSDDGDDGGGSLPAYADWLPAPAALNTDHYEFTAVDPGAIFADESAIRDSAFGSLTDLTEPLDGIALGDLSGLYVIGGRFVMTGEIDAAAVESFLGSNGYVEGESYHGYTFYTGGPGGTAAVSSDTAIRAGSLGDARGKVEAIVDAKRGAVDRYADASDACRTLLSRLGPGTIAGGQTYGEASYLDGAVADGFRWRLDGSSASFSGTFVFESQGGADTGAVEALVGDQSFFDQFDSPTVDQDGRNVVVDATAATGSVGRLGPQYGGSGRQRTPQVRFSFEYESRGDGAGVLTVQHDGGDSVQASELVFRGSGFVGTDAIPEAESGDLDVTERGRNWPVAKASSDLDGEAAVVAGDGARLGVVSDAEIRVVWESEDSATSAVLAAYQGPGA